MTTYDAIRAIMLRHRFTEAAKALGEEFPVTTALLETWRRWDEKQGKGK